MKKIGNPLWDNNCPEMVTLGPKFDDDGYSDIKIKNKILKTYLTSMSLPLLQALP